MPLRHYARDCERLHERLSRHVRVGQRALNERDVAVRDRLVLLGLRADELGKTLRQELRCREALVLDQPPSRHAERLQDVGGIRARLGIRSHVGLGCDLDEPIDVGDRRLMRLRCRRCGNRLRVGLIDDSIRLPGPRWPTEDHCRRITIDAARRKARGDGGGLRVVPPHAAGLLRLGRWRLLLGQALRLPRRAVWVEAHPALSGRPRRLRGCGRSTRRRPRPDACGPRRLGRRHLVRWLHAENAIDQVVLIGGADRGVVLLDELVGVKLVRAAVSVAGKGRLGVREPGPGVGLIGLRRQVPQIIRLALLRPTLLPDKPSRLRPLIVHRQRMHLLRTHVLVLLQPEPVTVKLVLGSPLDGLRERLEIDHRVLGIRDGRHGEELDRHGSVPLHGRCPAGVVV